jgi:hypothetical protein
MAGADVADHEATMRQTEHLVINELPRACVARVGPEGFRAGAAAVVKRICEQLTRQEAKPRACDEGPGDTACEGVDEAGEEDDVGLAIPREPEAGMQGVVMDFVDWHQERGTAGPVVLMVERVDAIPKDALLEVLNCWGTACCDAGIPMLVILGLHNPQQSMLDLLNGRPLDFLNFVGSVRLFDARAVCAELLEYVAQDTCCPQAMSLLVLQWLRRNFLSERISVSRMLNALAVLCEDRGVGHTVVEQRLSRGAVSLVTEVTASFHRGGCRQEQKSADGDTALLYRLFEYSWGRNVELSDLWQAFQAACATPPSTEAATVTENAVVKAPASAGGQLQTRLAGPCLPSTR